MSIEINASYALHSSGSSEWIARAIEIPAMWGGVRDFFCLNHGLNGLNRFHGLKNGGNVIKSCRVESSE